MKAQRLAIDGGQPVRTEPWPDWPPRTPEVWQRVELSFRDVFESGCEGLPWRKVTEVGERFAKLVEAEYGLLFPSGTAAIMAGLIGVLNPEPFTAGKREIIIPNYTFSATANAVLHHGFRCVFVDVDPETFTIDPAALSSALTDETVAVMPVHLGGQPADIDAISEIADAHGLKIIGDGAQAHGARYRGRDVGSYFDANGYSFQSTKNISTGEGGALVTDSEEIFARAQAYMNAGRLPGKKRWMYYNLGYNFRPSEYLAALLEVRMETFAAETRIRGDNAAYLSGLLRGIPGITPPRVAEATTTHAYHLYMMLYDVAAFGEHSRDEFVSALQAEGIDCTEGYTVPLSEFPAYVEQRKRHPEMFRFLPSPRCSEICNKSIWLFQQQLLDRSGMDQVAEAIGKIQRVWN